MGRPKKVDRNELHRLLWERRDRRGTYTFRGMDLAEEVGVTMYSFSRIMQEFIREGRIKLFKAAKANIKTYIIRNPEGFNGTSPGGEKSP